MATCVVTSTRCDPSTTPLQAPGSFIRFTLRNFLGFIPRVAGTNILAEIQIDAYPNSLGVVSQVLTTNTSITPQNTFYTAEVWSNGRAVDSANYIFNTSADLSTALQINPPQIALPILPPQGPIFFENNGSPNSSQNILNLESTNDSIDITDEGGGTINLVTMQQLDSPPTTPVQFPNFLSNLRSGVEPQPGTIVYVESVDVICYNSTAN